MKTCVTYRASCGIAEITLSSDVAGKPATMDLDVLDQLDQAIERIESDPAIRVAVIRGAGRKYFVVGADMRALQSITADSIVPWVRRGHAVMNRLAALPIPVIAAVTGYCLGGGLELALACDLIVADRGAKFGSPEAGLGFVPGWGGTWRLPRRIGEGRAKLLMFSGRTIDAGEASRMRLVDVLVDDAAALAAETSQLTLEIVRNSPVAIAFIKNVQAAHADLREAEEREIKASQGCLQDPGTQQRVARFLASRARKYAESQAC